MGVCNEVFNFAIDYYAIKIAHHVSLKRYATAYINMYSPKGILKAIKSKIS